MRELLELLEGNARLTTSELASMLGRSEYQIEQDIQKLEKDKTKSEFVHELLMKAAGRTL